MRIPVQTARLLQAIFDLLGKLKTSDPDLAVALEQGAARVSFDTRERVVLVSVVDENGVGHAVVAIQADPFDRATFGTTGTPEPVFGLYDELPVN